MEAGQTLLVLGIGAGALVLQIAFVLVNHRVRNALRERRGRPRIEDDPTVDRSPRGPRARRDRSTDPTTWRPVGRPERFRR